MKGKSIFITAIAIEIKNTLDQIAIAGRYANMSLRGSLRTKYNFYSSDFRKSRMGFTSADFDHQVSIGKIEIRKTIDIEPVAAKPLKRSQNGCFLKRDS